MRFSESVLSKEYQYSYCSVWIIAGISKALLKWHQMYVVLIIMTFLGWYGVSIPIMVLAEEMAWAV